MTFKSYAQAGQFSTYHIDLPIKAEINEDLRAAGDFAKQMERSQKYREKWASSYLSALNDKSNIERQNRDDNFEFLQNNFKAIYEGEQREFEGRLAELQREQAEAANAEPDFFDKLLPALIEFAPKIIGLVGDMQAANLAAGQEHIAGITQQMQQVGYTMPASEAESLQRLLGGGKLIEAGREDLQQQIIQSYIDKGVFKSEQDMMTYVNASGKLEAFRNVTAYQNAMPSISAALQKESRPNSGNFLDPALYPMQDGEYNTAITKALNDAQRHFMGNQPINDATQAEVVSKFHASQINGAMNQANVVWNKQATEMKTQHDTNIVNFYSTQDGFGQSMNNLYIDEKNRLIKAGATPSQAHMQAMTTTLNKTTLPGSMVSPAQIGEFRDFHFAVKDSDFIKGGQKPADNHRTWTNNEFNKAKQTATEASFKHTDYITKRTLNEDKRKIQGIKAELTRIPAGPNRQDRATKIQKEAQEDPGFIGRSAEYQKFILQLGNNAVIPQTSKITDKLGMTVESIQDTADGVLLKPVSNIGAYNKTQTPGKLKADPGFKIAKGTLVEHALANWDKYAGEAAHLTGEGLRHHVLNRAYEDLRKANVLTLTNVNTDGTVKEEAKAVTYGIPSSVNPTGETPDTFVDKAKVQGDGFWKPGYTSFIQGDDNVYRVYNGSRSLLPEGTNPSYLDMQSMINTPRMRLLKKAFPDKTVYEIIDMELQSLGYEGLREIPFTMQDSRNNSKIAERIMLAKSPIQSNTANNHARLMAQAAKGSGKTEEVNLGGGHIVWASSDGAAQSLRAAVKAASEAGINLGPVINNVGRDPKTNADAGGHPNSLHLRGLSLDINWNHRDAWWWKQYSSEFGWRYNRYSNRSTHYDHYQDQWEQSPYYSQKLEPIPVQPPEGIKLGDTQWANPSLEEQNRLLTTQDNPPPSREWYGRSRPVEPDEQPPTGIQGAILSGLESGLGAIGIETDLNRDGN